MTAELETRIKGLEARIKELREETEREIAGLDVELAELRREAEAGKPDEWPKIGDDYWSVSSFGGVSALHYRDDEIDMLLATPFAHRKKPRLLSSV